ncbi:MAG TPA: NAD(P)-dependent alcohol dehydrogenase [Candidatus Dormibacteraeota bacterium]|nr:NAD(P)-dependent alcohol dehydrogenase [Candidatus Dormibacteraeota bacterium]
MKAAVFTTYGPPDVVQITDVEKPVPKDHEVLIKVRAASVNPLDWHFVRGQPRVFRLAVGLRKPKVTRLGVDLAGQVEAVGSNVTQFKPADEVFGCARGAIAEYVCAMEEKLALKPANLSFEEAASVPVAALSALQGLRDKGRIQRGQQVQPQVPLRVLIDGASGGVGTFAVQIAKSFGAEVTAVCSTRNVDQARSIGATHVIDYTRQDFTHGAQRYDLILAANAYHSSFDYRRALAPDGIYVMVGGGAAQMLQGILLGPLLSLLGSKKLCFVSAKVTNKDLLILKDLLEAGKVVPIIDKRYPLSATAEALLYLEQGHAQGKVVITVDPASPSRR